MNDDIRTVLAGYVDEAINLRFEINLPGPHAGPQEIRDALLDVRHRMDRIEFFLSRAIRAKAGADRAAATAASLAEEAWDKAVHQNRGRPVRTDDYSSGKERHAEANLLVMEERRAARAVADLASACTEKVELLRLHFRGLSDLRHELLAILRLLQFESNLER